jgi:hypothetical protein
LSSARYKRIGIGGGAPKFRAETPVALHLPPLANFKDRGKPNLGVLVMAEAKKNIG